MVIIDIHNLNYSTSSASLFENLNLEIEEGSFTTIIGENGCGKTTLLKIFSGLIISDNYVKIDNIVASKFNIEEIFNRTSLISSNNEFFSKTVMSEILQDKKNITIFDENKAKKLLNDFGLSYLENISPLKLSYAENQIVSVIKAIIKNPRIIFLDNCFSKLDEEKRGELLNYIKLYAKENNITIVNTTNEISDLKYSDRILLIKNKNISFDGTYEDLIENIDLNKEGMKLPFEIDVSNKLIIYNLLSKKYESIDEIIGELCR